MNNDDEDDMPVLEKQQIGSDNKRNRIMLKNGKTVTGFLRPSEKSSGGKYESMTNSSTEKSVIVSQLFQTPKSRVKSSWNSGKMMECRQTPDLFSKYGDFGGIDENIVGTEKNRKKNEGVFIEIRPDRSFSTGNAEKLKDSLKFQWNSRDLSDLREKYGNMTNSSTEKSVIVASPLQTPKNRLNNSWIAGKMMECRQTPDLFSKYGDFGGIDENIVGSEKNRKKNDDVLIGLRPASSLSTGNAENLKDSLKFQWNSRDFSDLREKYGNMTNSSTEKSVIVSQLFQTPKSRVKSSWNSGKMMECRQTPDFLPKYGDFGGIDENIVGSEKNKKKNEGVIIENRPDRSFSTSNAENLNDSLKFHGKSRDLTSLVEDNGNMTDKSVVPRETKKRKSKNQRNKTVQTPVFMIKEKVNKESVASKRLGEKIKKISVKDFKPVRNHLSKNEIVQNVYNGLKSMKKALGKDANTTFLKNIGKITSQLTGVSERTIARRSKKVFPRALRKLSRNNRRKAVAEKTPEVIKEGIRIFFDEKWAEQKHVTVEMLKEFAEVSLNFKKSKGFLILLLHGMGLCYRKKSGMPHVEERTELIKLREKFLAKKLLYDNPPVSDPRPALYGSYDETWVFEGMSTSRAWQYVQTNKYQMSRMADFTQPRSGPAQVKSRGTRAIVIAIVTQFGIVPESAKILVSGNEAAQHIDYHKDMTASSFEEYMKNVLPNFAQMAKDRRMRPVLLLDNASIHCRTIEKLPTKNSTKAEFVEYLRNKLNYDVSTEGNSRNELRDMFLSYLDAEGGRYALKKFYMDEWAKNELGVDFLRLPPYHCFLSSIELLWARMKDYVLKEGSTNDKLKEVCERTQMFLDNVKPELCKSLFEHVEKFEQELREKIREKEEEEARIWRRRVMISSDSEDEV